MKFGKLQEIYWVLIKQSRFATNQLLRWGTFSELNIRVPIEEYQITPIVDLSFPTLNVCEKFQLNRTFKFSSVFGWKICICSTIVNLTANTGHLILLGGDSDWQHRLYFWPFVFSIPPFPDGDESYIKQRLCWWPARKDGTTLVFI